MLGSLWDDLINHDLEHLDAQSEAGASPSDSGAGSSAAGGAGSSSFGMRPLKKFVIVSMGLSPSGLSMSGNRSFRNLGLRHNQIR